MVQGKAGIIQNPSVYRIQGYVAQVEGGQTFAAGDTKRRKTKGRDLNHASPLPLEAKADFIVSREPHQRTPLSQQNINNELPRTKLRGIKTKKCSELRGIKPCPPLAY